MSTVSQDPSNIAARHIAVDAGRGVVASIKNVANGINDLRKLVGDSIVGNLSDFNKTIGLLGSVQTEILGNAIPNRTPNNLLDQRDAYLKTLSEFADISVDYLKNNSVRVTLGTTGQGQTLVDGFNYKKLKLQNVDGASKIYIDDGASSASTILQIQSGEIAGYMAADIALTETKRSLDDLTKSLVAEFNEIHRFGVDLEGVQGKDFFSLDAIEINKISIRESTAQLRVDGNLENSMGETLSVKYSGSEDLWVIADQSGKKLKEFKGSTELNGLRFNVEGKSALGDSFNVKITNNASENLQIKIKDGKDLACLLYTSPSPRD